MHQNRLSGVLSNLGFTVLESMVAMVLVGISMAASVALVSMMTTTLQKNREFTTRDLLRSKIE